ncbi:MAG: hypothetical protein ACD_60C00024G0019 [uncultured bacterium]|nr:MAG: hypothetical protein ACD_60C00024G0019 [uncultured bacterium]
MNHAEQGYTKWIVIMLLMVAMLVGMEIYFDMMQRKEHANTIKISGTYLEEAKDVPHFKLSASVGKTFSEKNLQGHWTMMFFGFTNCGMVCPTTMSALSGMYKTLEKTLPANQLPEVVMVSVDPDRDSIGRMKEYVTSFDSHFIGLRADIQKTIALEKALHIAAAKIEAGPGKNQYTINHSAEILLFNPKGQLQAYLDYPPTAKQLAEDYQLILKATELKGKWIILNYWAAWCESCMKEIPELNRFYQHHQTQNVVLYGVNYDQLPKKELTEAIQKTHIIFPVLLQNPEGIFALKNIEALPVTVVINPNGKMVKKIMGGNTEKSLDSLLADLGGE